MISESVRADTGPREAPVKRCAARLPSLLATHQVPDDADDDQQYASRNRNPDDAPHKSYNETDRDHNKPENNQADRHSWPPFRY